MENLSALVSTTINLEQAIVSFLLFLNFFSYLFILLKGGNKKFSQQILKYLLLSFFLFYFQWFAFAFNIKNIYLPLFFLPIFSLIFIPILAYTYIDSITSENYKFKKKQFTHFVFPIIVSLVALVLNCMFFIGFITENRDLYFKWGNIFMDFFYFTITYILFGLLSLYFTLSVLKYQYFRKKILSHFSSIDKIRMRWVLVFICVIYFFLLSQSLLTSEVTSKYISQFILEISEHSTSFIVFFILLTYTHKQENYFDLYSNHERIIHLKTYEVPKSIENADNKDTLLSEATVQDIQGKLSHLLEENKIFLNNSLSSFELAKLLNTNRTYLSIVIQEKFNTNFYNLINSYRVEEAKKYLSHEEFHKYTLDAIAEMSGFATRTVFYRTFKRLVNETPAEFKKKSMKLKE